MTKLVAIIKSIRNELEFAEQEHPNWPVDAIHAAAIVAEESGELQRAALQAVYEPSKADKESMRGEATQTAVAAIRFLLSIDGYVHETRFAPGTKPKSVSFDHVPEVKVIWSENAAGEIVGTFAGTHLGQFVCSTGYNPHSKPGLTNTWAWDQNCGMIEQAMVAVLKKQDELNAMSA